MEDAGCKNSVFVNSYFNSTTDYVSTLWRQATAAANGHVGVTVQDNDKADVPVLGNNKVLLVIGDSTDRIMMRHMCELLHGVETNVDPTREYSRPNVCTASLGEHSTFAAGYLNIFGMHHPCSNGGNVELMDPRPFNTTAERISVVLEEVLDKIPWNVTMTTPLPKLPVDAVSKTRQYDVPLEVYVQVGSNLWDLSDGCNDQADVTDEYAQQYREGIALVHDAIQTSITSYLEDFSLYDEWGNKIERPTHIHVIWKLAPPVSMRYSNNIKKLGGGRTRSNQQQLNKVMLETVTADAGSATSAFQLGSGMIDLWSVVKTNMPSEAALDEELRKDGRHYSVCPNVAFFNTLLGEIHQISSY